MADEDSQRDKTMTELYPIGIPSKEITLQISEEQAERVGTITVQQMLLANSMAFTRIPDCSDKRNQISESFLD